MTNRHDVTILGIFVADTAYRAARTPKTGETMLGSSFSLGPGGKGSNQAVAAARLGAHVNFISKVGDDAFADLAFRTWAAAGVHPHVVRDSASYTGAAGIFVEESSGDNAIIVCPGAATTISARYVQQHAALIQNSAVFVTQLEQPVDAAVAALELAHRAKAITILNPAPAASLTDAVLSLCDFVTPNETEASQLTGMPVETVNQARCAGDALLKRGARQVVITLGEQGALLHNQSQSVHVPAFRCGAAVDTAGAGDAFNGAMAAALAENKEALEAVKFGCLAAGVSVTRVGTADAMPTLEAIQQLSAH